MKKSILYIFVVLMALSLTLGAVSAEDVAADTAVAADEEAPATDVVTEDDQVADLAVDVEILEETPYRIIWGVAAINNGPDTAEYAYVDIDGGDNLYLYGTSVTKGNFFDPALEWFIGDLAPGEIQFLIVDTIKVADGPYFVDASISSNTFDPNLSNNYDIAWSGAEASAAVETLPATGNPIAMVLLALISLAGATFARRF